MAEWWTYDLSDLVIFAPRAYYRLIERYNDDVWPAQILPIVCGLAILVLVLRKGEGWQGRVVAAILATAWLFVAWGFFLQRFSALHWAAEWFAAAFAVEALLLVLFGVVGGQLQFEPVARALPGVGLAVALFAFVAHPLIGPLLGRSWQSAELFGMHPDPTALASLGVLILAAGRVHWPLLVLPLAWCCVSGATLLAMDATDAMTAPVVALVVLASAAWKSISFRRMRARAKTGALAHEVAEDGVPGLP